MSRNARWSTQSTGQTSLPNLVGVLLTILLVLLIVYLIVVLV